jgi:hypothetical protein
MDDPEAISIEEKEEFRAFVGPNWGDYYYGALRRILTGKGVGASYNWAAFVLPGFWFPYRKMYLATAILYGVAFLEIILGDKTPGIVDFGVPLLIFAICGAYGNRWYLSHAKREIAVVRQRFLERDIFLQRLANRGGTSLVSAIGVPIMCMNVMVIVLVVLEVPIL